MTPMARQAIPGPPDSGFASGPATARRMRGLIAGVLLLAGLAAGVMHMAWSAGFWRQWLARRPAAPQGATA